MRSAPRRVLPPPNTCRHAPWFVVALSLAVISFTGCALMGTSQSPADLHFDLGLSESTIPSDVEPTFDRPLVFPALSGTDSIAYRFLIRRSKVQLHYHETYKWGESPDQMVHQALVDELLRRRLFDQVVATGPGRPPALLMTGLLHRFEFAQSAGELHAYCEIRLELSDLGSGKTIWSVVLSGREQVPSRDATDMAQAMAEAVREVARNMADEIAQLDLQS